MSDDLGAMDFEKVQEAAREMAASGNFPPSYWLTYPNMTPGTTYIVVPQAGNLWVYYAWGSAPATQIGVWHEGGTTTPIQGGENNIPVNYGDMIYYSLGNPGQDTIKLGYQMT